MNEVTTGVTLLHSFFRNILSQITYLRPTSHHHDGGTRHSPALALVTVACTIQPKATEQSKRGTVGAVPQTRRTSRQSKRHIF